MEDLLSQDSATQTRPSLIARLLTTRLQRIEHQYSSRKIVHRLPLPLSDGPSSDDFNPRIDASQESMPDSCDTYVAKNKTKQNTLTLTGVAVYTPCRGGVCRMVVNDSRAVWQP